MPADTILYNARIATNGVPSFVEAVAVTDGKIAASGSDHEKVRVMVAPGRSIDQPCPRSARATRPHAAPRRVDARVGEAAR